MKSIRINKQRLKQINKWCLQRNQEVNHSKCPKVEAEHWLHSVINAIQDGITVMDTDYNILLQNKATRWLNNGQEITGQPCYKIHYGRQEPCENCHTVEAMETGQLIKKNQPYQQEGPSGKTFEVYAYPITDEHGSTTGVVEYLRDITELKKREEALQQSESRYESILDATNTGVWEYDSHLQMDRLSTTFFTYLGYDPADYTDEEGFTSTGFFSNIVHPEDRDQEINSFKQYLSDGSPGIYESTFRIRKKDDTWLWMMSRGKTLRDKEGKPTNITLGTMTDITSNQLTHLYQQLGLQVLQISNQRENMITSLQQTAETIQCQTSFDVVGIRLKQEEDFPFLVKAGSLSMENDQSDTLLIRDDKGDILRDETGRPLLSCACGRVLSGNLSLEHPWTTPFGSFWTNELSQFFDKKAPEDLKALFDDRCLHKQFKSLALIPLRNKEDIVGLMYLADSRSGSFTPEMVELLEVLAAVLGEALAHKVISQQLKDKERESTLLISQMQLGLALHEVICDEAGSPVDYRFLSVNDSFERLTGLRREDLIGNTVLEVLPNTETYWIQTFGNVALTGISCEFENYSTELGKYFHVNVYSPQPSQFAVIVDDVTEKRKAALDLTQAKEDAEAANKAKTQFLANMSHELRTPLNGLMGMLQLLQSSPLDKDQQEYIQIALGSSQSLTRVVEDILNYTNLEKRTQKIIEEPFRLEGLLQEVAGLHKSAAVHKGLLLNVYQEKNLPDQVMGDRFKLKQILGNLVGNAVKFTESGVVQLSVKQSGEKAGEGRMKTCFQVKDTGVGIPSEKMEYIFQRFSQADESHTRVYGGLGLGLAVAREQATILCGSLTAESTPGQGSVFTLICEVGLGLEPKLAAERMEAGKIYYPQTRFSGTQVLVVDDDYASGLIAQLHLEKMGCDVEVYTDGQTAVEKMTAKEYQLVFMDCQMPVMDGYEATQCIRKMEIKNGRHTPIIAMTAKVLPGDREKCLEAGMDGFLAKPIEVDRLKAAVKRFTSEGRTGQ